MVFFIIFVIISTLFHLQNYLFVLITQINLVKKKQYNKEREIRFKEIVIVIQSEAKNLENTHVDVFEILRYTSFRSEWQSELFLSLFTYPHTYEHAFPWYAR